jgi:hypothetical protein
VYIVFFLLLAFLGYGGLFWRDRPLLILISIVSVLLLILVPMSGDIVISTEFGGTLSGSEGGSTTNLSAGGSDEYVLLSLDDGWEYTAWIWINVFILMIHFTVFLKEILSGVL